MRISKRQRIKNPQKWWRDPKSPKFEEELVSLILGIRSLFPNMISAIPLAALILGILKYGSKSNYAPDTAIDQSSDMLDWHRLYITFGVPPILWVFLFVSARNHLEYLRSLNFPAPLLDTWVYSGDQLRHRWKLISQRFLGHQVHPWFQRDSVSGHSNHCLAWRPEHHG